MSEGWVAWLSLRRVSGRVNRAVHAAGWVPAPILEATADNVRRRCAGGRALAGDAEGHGRLSAEVRVARPGTDRLACASRSVAPARQPFRTSFCARGAALHGCRPACGRAARRRGSVAIEAELAQRGFLDAQALGGLVRGEHAEGGGAIGGNAGGGAPAAVRTGVGLGRPPDGRSVPDCPSCGPATLPFLTVVGVVFALFRN
jgi:hypothetical protein